MTEPNSAPPPMPAESSKGLRWFHYLLGVSALIPYLGVVTGVAALAIGIIHFKRGGWVLVLLALLGFGITGGGSYLAYEHFLVKSGVLGDVMKKTSEGALTLLVKDIEAYKEAHGQYPQALTDLSEEAKKHNMDIEGMHGNFTVIKPMVYQLQPDGQTYYLFSNGPDGIPNTADDRFPMINPSEAAKIGYRPRPLNPGSAATPNP